MIEFTNSVEDAIGDHNKAVINGETISNDSKYNDTFYIDDSDDNITYPWDKELSDLPIHEDILLIVYAGLFLLLA